MELNWSQSWSYHHFTYLPSQEKSREERSANKVTSGLTSAHLLPLSVRRSTPIQGKTTQESRVLPSFLTSMRQLLSPETPILQDNSVSPTMTTWQCRHSGEHHIMRIQCLWSINAFTLSLGSQNTNRSIFYSFLNKTISQGFVLMSILFAKGRFAPNPISMSSLCSPHTILRVICRVLGS